jgi:hypothetical protein
MKDTHDYVYMKDAGKDVYAPTVSPGHRRISKVCTAQP